MKVKCADTRAKLVDQKEMHKITWCKAPVLWCVNSYFASSHVFIFPQLFFCMTLISSWSFYLMKSSWTTDVSWCSICLFRLESVVFQCVGGGCVSLPKRAAFVFHTCHMSIVAAVFDRVVASILKNCSPFIRKQSIPQDLAFHCRFLANELILWCSQVSSKTSFLYCSYLIFDWT